MAALLLLGCIIIYFADQRKNPPGFFIDESSIAWNALQIARHGVDEHGVRFPLYFEAFGEYKNPTYIYLLAGVLKVTGPSNLAARRLSAFLGYLACVTIGALAWRISRSTLSTALTFLTALFTPMIFEISRLAFEVALYPLATALFLLAAWNATRRTRWTARDVAFITITLVLLTYTYSIGRLFAALLAVTLFVFYTRERRSQLIAIAIAFIAFAVVPIVMYNATHEGALTRRFHDLTYVDAKAPVATLTGFEQHFIDNMLPLGMALRGDPNARHHVPGSGGSILLMTFILATIGALLATRSRDRWWIFVAIGMLLSLVPASLTNDQYHTLRLAPYAVFLIVLSIPAIEWLRAHRAVAIAMLAIGAMQTIWFFAIFYRDGAKRTWDFDHGARRAVDIALDRGVRPVYIDPGLYVHAYWYGAQRDVDPSQFVREIPTGKPGAIVISGKGPAADSVVLSDSEGWTVYESR